MTRVGWLADDASHVGGAELTQAEFRAAAPVGVEVISGAPGDLPEADLYVVHNCVLFSRSDLEPMAGKPVFKYWHDVGPHVQPGVREWLDENATPICCSPAQAEYMGLTDAVFIPPAVDLDRFEAAADSAGERSGSVCIASWRNYGKAAHKAAEWGASNGGVVFYGGGIAAPVTSLGEVSQDAMPELLARYETFVFLPIVIEPFGRIVAEAYAAGCSIVTNDHVGAKYWLTEKPDAVRTAAGDFWRLVLA